MEKATTLGIRLLLAATAISSSTPALAQSPEAVSPREAELAARVTTLESELQALRSDLASLLRSQTDNSAALAAVTATVNSTAAQTATASVRPPLIKDAGTSLKIGGFIKLTATNSRFSDGEVANNSLGRDFYLPQTIPTGNGPASRVQDFSAKQTRLWLDVTTQISGHNVRGYVEADFQTSPGTQGTQRTTNGYNIALRRAFFQLDRFTFGQDWTTFQYVGALPETTDYLGPTEGTVFIRQPLIRYSHPLGQGLTLHASIENPETASATLGSPALIENGDDSLPDFATRLAYTGKFGELSLAGLLRQVRVDNRNAAGTTSQTASAMGWGISGGGKINLGVLNGADVRFMATYGSNISRYVGVNFAPDAVYDPVNNRLEDVRVFATFGALRIPITSNVRVNLIGSYQDVDYSDALSRTSIAAYNRRAWSGAANIFWSPIPKVDLGVEYKHGKRTLVNGDSGSLDRMEFSARYSF